MAATAAERKRVGGKTGGTQKGLAVESLGAKTTGEERGGDERAWGRTGGGEMDREREGKGESGLRKGGVVKRAGDESG